MVRLGALVLSLLLLAAAATAQTVSATTGAINGKVTDTSGAVLPGVTVTIASASMMGTRNNVTSDDGLYRFPAVPPGEYTITYELAGFNTIKREGIRVTLGFTATVNVELAVASLQESVTVTGESPVVDTQATRITTNFDAKQLANMPSARDYWAILAESPGVALTRIDVGGSAAGTQTGYIVYGTSGQNRPMVEGIVATEGTGAAGFYYDYGSFDEVAVNTAAHSAEMPWAGVQSVFVSKSGGNEYHGTFYGDYEKENWQSFNVDQDQIKRGARGGGGLSPRDVNRLTSYHDVNADVGGYVKKDKIWWYFSGRDQDVSAQYVNFPVKPHRTRLTNYGGKGTYTLSENNRLIGYGQAGRKHQPTRLDSFLLGNTTGINTAESTTWEQLYWGWVWKGEWNSVINDKMFYEVRAGQFGYNWPNRPNGSDARFEDIGNNLITGGNRDWRRDRRRNQILGSFSYFKDGWGGNHNFKFGGEIFRETVTDYRYESFPGNILHSLTNGRPTDIYFFETPSQSDNGLWTYAGYANDSWRLNTRLSLNLGIRLDRYRLFFPAQTHPAGRFNPTEIKFAAVDNVLDWNLVSPRIGATYDISGDGKTVVKFNYGQYWFNPGADFLYNVNPNQQDWWSRYSWTDLNGNGRWDPGEQGSTLLDRRGGATEILDQSLEDTYTREVAGWFERELMANFGIRTGVVWRGERQHYGRTRPDRPFSAFNIPRTVPDPGPDGVLGNADDGPGLAGFALTPTGLPVTNLTANVPNSDSNYYTWEITGTKRFTNRWSLLATFARTWSRDQASSYFGNAVRANTLPQTPNDLINTGNDQAQYRFTTWQAKVHGTFEAPKGIRITPIVRHQSGQPYGRTFTSTVLGYGSVRFLAEPINSRRQDNITIVDIRVEKGFRLTRSRRVAPFMDIFNLLNTNAAQNIGWSSGASYLRPLQIVPPRLLRIGAKLEW